VAVFRGLRKLPAIPVHCRYPETGDNKTAVIDVREAPERLLAPVDPRTILYEEWL
jgi:hypothetical protein